MESAPRQWIAVCAFTSGQCNRELHEDCSAYTGEDCSGSRSAVHRRSFAPRSLGHSPCPHERLSFMTAAIQPQAKLATNPYVGIVGVFLGATLATMHAGLFTA